MEKKLFSIAVLMLGLLVPALLCGQAWAVDVQISQLTDDLSPRFAGGFSPNLEEAKAS